MPTRLNDIETSFHLRVNEALKGLDQIIARTERAEKALGNTQQSFDRLGKSMALFGAASTAAFGLAIKGALEEEQQIGQLRATIEGIGDSFEAQRPGIESFIDGLTKVTRFSDDELRPALNRAILATNSVDEGMRAAELGAKVAAAGFGNLEQNATLIARLFEGQVGAIGRLIPEFRDLEERLEAGETQASLAAEALDRLNSIAAEAPKPDSLNLLTKAVGELRDATGKAAFEGLEPLIKALTSAAEAAEVLAASGFGKVVIPLLAFAGVLSTVSGGLIIFAGNVVKNGKELGNLFTKIPGLTRVLGILAAAFAGPGGLIALAIAAGIAFAGFSIILNKLSKAADEARDKVFASDRVTQFRAEIDELNATIAKLEAGEISAAQSLKEFNKFGVQTEQQAKQRVETLGRIVSALEKQGKGERDVEEEIRKGIATTREAILATEKIADARLEAEAARVKAGADLGEISGLDAAKQEAEIANQRVALHITTLKKLLAFEIEFGRQRVDAGLQKEREYAEKIEQLRGEILEAEIQAGTVALTNDATIIQARLKLQESSNQEFIDLIQARQDADIAATDAQIAVGKKRESELTELLLGQLNERAAFQRADVEQRLDTLQKAGLEESKLAEDLNADLIKIDLAAQAQRSGLEATLANQRRAEIAASAQIDRELRRALLVDGEKNVQAARLAEIELAFEEERATWEEHLANQVISYEDYLEVLASLDANRARQIREVTDEAVASQRAIGQAAEDAGRALFTLAGNFAVDLVSGVDDAGKAASKFFRQIISDLSRAIARALILQAIIAAVGGPTSFIGSALSKLFQDPVADSMARFEGSRFADLFFQGMFREFNTSQERMESALTQNRDINRSNSQSMTAIVNEATPETTVEFTDRHVEPRVRQRANQRSSRGILTDAERDRKIESLNDRLNTLGAT